MVGLSFKMGKVLKSVHDLAPFGLKIGLHNEVEIHNESGLYESGL